MSPAHPSAEPASCSYACVGPTSANCVALPPRRFHMHHAYCSLSSTLHEPSLALKRSSYNLCCLLKSQPTVPCPCCPAVWQAAADLLRAIPRHDRFQVHLCEPHSRGGHHGTLLCKVSQADKRTGGAVRVRVQPSVAVLQAIQTCSVEQDVLSAWIATTCRTCVEMPLSVSPSASDLVRLRTQCCSRPVSMHMLCNLAILIP